MDMRIKIVEADQNCILPNHDPTFSGHLAIAQAAGSQNSAVIMKAPATSFADAVVWRQKGCHFVLAAHSQAILDSAS
jgi:hypothetical protein